MRDVGRVLPLLKRRVHHDRVVDGTRVVLHEVAERQVVALGLQELAEAVVDLPDLQPGLGVVLADQPGDRAGPGGGLEHAIPRSDSREADQAAGDRFRRREEPGDGLAHQLRLAQLHGVGLRALDAPTARDVFAERGLEVPRVGDPHLLEPRVLAELVTQPVVLRQPLRLAERVVERPQRVDLREGELGAVQLRSGPA